MTSWHKRNILRVALLGLAIGLAGLTAAANPPTADAAVRQAMTALAANEPDVIFGMLPLSYRQDLEALVVGFAGRMDGELWEQGRRLVKQVAGLGQTQRNLLIQLVVEQSGPNADPARTGASLDAAVTLLRQLADSRIAELDRLRQGQLAQLLATEGRPLMQAIEQVARTGLPEETTNPWAMAETLDAVALVEAGEAQTGAQAWVKIEADQDPVAFTRVEAVWIPSDWAQGWSEFSRNAMESIAKIDFISPEGQKQKSQTLMVMNMLEGVIIPQLARATSVQELQSSVMGLMIMLGGGMMWQ